MNRRPSFSKLVIVLVAIVFGPLMGCNSSPGYDEYIRALRLQKEGGSRAEIEQLLDKAIMLAPSNSQYFQERGRYYFDLAEYARAETDFSESIKLNAHPYTYYLQGLTAGKLRKYDAARTAFLESIKLDPVNGQFHGGLALAELALGHLDDALAAIDKAKSLDKNFSRWRYTRGMILTHLRRFNEAAEELSTFIVYSKARPSGGIEDVYANGAREVARCRAMTPNDLQVFWHYGGRWSPPGLIQSYESRG